MTDHLNEWVSLLPWFESSNYDGVMHRLSQQELSNRPPVPQVDYLLEPFRYFSPDQTRVIILGEAPYDTPGVSDGLAFSVAPSVSPLPGGLISLFDELLLDTGVDHHHNGSLTGWAQQGVLLLNCSLSVPVDHGWHGLIQEAIEAAVALVEHLVIVKLGDLPRLIAPTVLSRNHLVISCNGPTRIGTGGGFIGSRIFSKTNRFFADHHLPLIDWSK